MKLKTHAKGIAAVVATLALVVFGLAACGGSSSTGGSEDTVSNESTVSSESAAGNESASGGESVQGKSVALIDCSEQVPWCSGYNKTISAEMEKAGVKVTTLTDPFDPAVQDQHMNQAIAEHPDAIILLASNSSSIIPAVARAKAAGIPVVNTDGPLAEGGEEQLAFQVLANHTAMGRFAAEGLVEGLEEEGVKSGNIFVAAGPLAGTTAQERLAGFKGYLKKYPQYKIVSVQDTNFEESKATQDASQIIAQYQGRGGIQGAYGMNDLLALGIVKAAQQAGEKVGVKEHGMVVVGGNCLAPGVPAVREGILQTSGTQTPTKEGEVVSQHVLAFLGGKSQPKTVMVPEFKITKENVDEFAKECTF